MAPTYGAGILLAGERRDGRNRSATAPRIAGRLRVGLGGLELWNRVNPILFGKKAAAEVVSAQPRRRRNIPRRDPLESKIAVLSSTSGLEAALTRTLYSNHRREFLRTAGIAAAGMAAFQPGRAAPAPQGALNEKLFASKYLLESYTKAADALREFDNLSAEGRADQAREALARAAAAICDGLSRLAEDPQFWTSLAEQRNRIGQNSSEVKRLLARLDDFLPAEEKALQSYMPPGPRTRLVASLSLAISRFRREPADWTLENVRSGVQSCRDAACAAAKAPKTEPRSHFFSNLRMVGYGLGALGGVATIAVNSFTSMALPVALTSIVGGVATVIGSSTALTQEIQSRPK